MIIVTQGKMRLNTCTDFVPLCTEIVLLQTEMQKSWYTYLNDTMSKDGVYYKNETTHNITINQRRT